MAEKEKSVWDKTKEQAAKAADATKRATKKLNHQGWIATRKMKIQNAKRRYGVGIYDAFDDADMVFAQQLFLELREQVAALEQDIVDREQKILSECDPKYVPAYMPTSIATHEAAKQNYGSYSRDPPAPPLPKSPVPEGKEEKTASSSPALQHALKPAMSTGRKAKTVMSKASLLEWVQETLQGYNGVTVRDLDKSWVNGLAFAALIYHYEPQLVTLSVLDPAKPDATLKVAFDAAETLGVTVLLDSEDVPLADERSITSAVTMYHKKLSTMTPSQSGRTQWNARFK